MPRAVIAIAAPAFRLPFGRAFSISHGRRQLRDIAELSDRVQPTYTETHRQDLLKLQWPSPPQNILLVKKDHITTITESIQEYAKHIKECYPSTAILLERGVAEELHEKFDFPVYTTLSEHDSAIGNGFTNKVDLISTLGGDGTILHASALFAKSKTVPPILAFSMGSLGFLGEWKFKEYKRAFREAYMSAAHIDQNGGGADPSALATGVDPRATPAGWSTIRGKFMGNSRNSKVLLRNRLKVGIFSPDGEQVASNTAAASDPNDIFAMNEVILHRGKAPHLAIVEVSVGGRFLTEAVADGIIVSTPTGSTAYSLSSGGSIVHPLVSSLLITPICPRSLSFRPLVLPANTPITLRLSEKNRGREVEVSIDGISRPRGLTVGMEIRVSGEDVTSSDGSWTGGVPSIVRGAAESDIGGEDSWVGGLNRLLKFNHAFGEEQ